MNTQNTSYQNPSASNEPLNHSARVRNKLLSTIAKCCSTTQNSFSPLFKGKVWLIESVEDFFETFGHYVFDHPWRFIIVPLVVCLLLSIGFTVREPELDMERLYSLPVSLTATAKQELHRVFPIERITYIFVTSENEGELLARSHLQHLAQFWSKITRLQVPRWLSKEAAIPGDLSVLTNWFLENDPDQLRFDPNFSGNNSMDKPPEKYISLKDVCIHETDGSCKTVNPLELYPSSSSLGSPLRTLRYPTSINFRTQKAYRIDSLLGGIVKKVVGSTTIVYNATAASFRLDLNGNPDYVVNSAAFEQALIVVVKNMQLPGLKLFIRAERSLSDELALSCQLRGEDLTMLICAATFVFVFTVAINTSLDRYRSKWWPAAVGVFSTLLAYGGGVGMCHLFGLKHVPPSESTPFILLGIGIDDIFVISNAYSLTYLHSQNARTRIGLCLRDAGISVTITTLTNILAFLVGASSPYYSIRIFCIVTATGLFAGYLLCLTFFSAVLSLNAVTEQRHRAVPLWEHASSDVSLSVQNKPKLNLSPLKSMSEANAQNSTDSNPTRKANGIRKKCSTSPFIDPLTKLDDSDDNSPGSHYNSSTRAQTPQTSPAEESQSSSLPIGGSRDNLSTQKSNLQSTLGRDDDRQLNTRLKIFRNFEPIEQNDNSSELLSRQPYITSGYFTVEKLENHLVVSERVAEMCEKKQKRKLIRRTAEKIEDQNTAAMIETNEANENHSNTTESRIEMTLLERNGIDQTDNGQLRRPLFNSSNEEPVASTAMPALTDQQQNLKFDVSSMPRLVRVQQQLIPLKALNLKEPYGTVGTGPRYLFMHYYGPFLMQPIVKATVLFSFLALVAFSIYNSTNVEAGLKVRDITPFNSYLREFCDVRENYFVAYGDECIVFFPNGGQWWNADVQEGILNLTNSIRSSDHTVFVLNGLEEFLAYVKLKNEKRLEKMNGPNSIKNERENITKSIPREDLTSVVSIESQRYNFMMLLQEFLKTPRGLPYTKMFTIENGLLTSWKFYYWLRFQDNTRVAIEWFQETQQFLKDAEDAELFKGYVFTPLAVMWESDPVILGATVANMIIALISMGIVASLLIPDLVSGLLVLLVIVMIDLDVYAFIPVWNLNLNMLTMVNLVLSIGFAVDCTAHITHCFNHCKGKTRDRRVIETLLLMGLPVSEGMLSTYAAVGALSFAHKYVLVVVFRMTTFVVAFAFLHGVVLMPVILSFVGPMKPREIDVVELRDGEVVSTYTIDEKTGMVLKQLSYQTKLRHSWLKQASLKRCISNIECSQH